MSACMMGKQTPDFYVARMLKKQVGRIAKLEAQIKAVKNCQRWAHEGWVEFWKASEKDIADGRAEFVKISDVLAALKEQS